MKKIIIFALTAVLLLSFCLSASASTVNGNEYQIGEKTIIFEENSTFTTEKQQAIAELLANPEYGIATANVLCSLFGHKNTTELATVITHCASANAPRCKEETFEVTTCSRCDESTITLIGVGYISCCPED